jgi:hypothetical protein
MIVGSNYMYMFDRTLTLRLSSDPFNAIYICVSRSLKKEYDESTSQDNVSRSNDATAVIRYRSLICFSFQEPGKYFMGVV